MLSRREQEAIDRVVHAEWGQEKCRLCKTKLASGLYYVEYAGGQRVLIWLCAPCAMYEAAQRWRGGFRTRLMTWIHRARPMHEGFQLRERCTTPLPAGVWLRCPPLKLQDPRRTLPRAIKTFYISYRRIILNGRHRKAEILTEKYECHDECEALARARSVRPILADAINAKEERTRESIKLRPEQIEVEIYSEEYWQQIQAEIAEQEAERARSRKQRST